MNATKQVSSLAEVRKELFDTQFTGDESRDPYHCQLQIVIFEYVGNCLRDYDYSRTHDDIWEIFRRAEDDDDVRSFVMNLVWPLYCWGSVCESMFVAEAVRTPESDWFPSDQRWWEELPNALAGDEELVREEVFEAYMEARNNQFERVAPQGRVPVDRSEFSLNGLRKKINANLFQPPESFDQFWERLAERLGIVADILHCVLHELMVEFVCSFN